MHPMLPHKVEPLATGFNSQDEKYIVRAAQLKLTNLSFSAYVQCTFNFGLKHIYMLQVQYQF